MTSTSNHRAGRAIAMAAFLPAFLFAVSSQVASAAESASQAAPTAAVKVERPSVDRVEARIADLRKKLQITSDQEALWTDVATVMRENEKKMRASITARSEKMKTMNAVDDLRSYRMITDEHADGLKRLIPAFEALYAKMTPAQQKNADHVFDRQQRAPRRT